MQAQGSGFFRDIYEDVLVLMQQCAWNLKETMNLGSPLSNWGIIPVWHRS